MKIFMNGRDYIVVSYHNPYLILLSGWSLTDSIGPADVGIAEEISDDDRGHGTFGLNKLDREARWAQPITYLDIHECDSFMVIPTSIFMPILHVTHLDTLKLTLPNT